MLERKKIILYLHPKIIRVPANSYKKPTLVVERGNLMLYTNKQENNLGRARFHLLAVQVIQGILEDLHVFDANGSVVLEFPICPHLCMTLETVAEVHPSIGCFWHEYFWAVFWGVRMGWGGCWCYAAELLVTTNRSKPEAMQRKIRVRQWKTGWEGKIGLLLTQWLSCFSSEKTGAAPIMVKSHGLNFSRSCYISAISFRPQSTCLKQRLRNVWSITGGDEVKSRSKGACLVVSSGERLRVSSLSLSQSVSQSVSLSVCQSVCLSRSLCNAIVCICASACKHISLYYLFYSVTASRMLWAEGWWLHKKRFMPTRAWLPTAQSAASATLSPARFSPLVTTCGNLSNDPHTHTAAISQFHPISINARFTSASCSEGSEGWITPKNMP